MKIFHRFGRINRASYWLALGSVVAVYTALILLTANPPHVAEVVLIIFATPRLHDIGKSGWWAGGVFLAEISIVVVVALVTLSLDTAMIVFGLFAFVLMGLLIWLGARRPKFKSLWGAAESGNIYVSLAEGERLAEFPLRNGGTLCREKSFALLSRDVGPSPGKFATSCGFATLPPQSAINDS